MSLLGCIMSSDLEKRLELLDYTRSNLPRLKNDVEAHAFVLESYERRLEYVRVHYGYCEGFVDHYNWLKSYLGVEHL